MKKIIPEKIANIVYDKMLSGKKNLTDYGRRSYTYRVLFKPDTTKISNRFFKNKVSLFCRTYRKDDWDIENKLISTIKRWESTEDQLNDYFQEK